MVSRDMASVRFGPLSTWQCRHARLQARPMLTWTVPMDAGLSGATGRVDDGTVEGQGRSRSV